MSHQVIDDLTAEFGAFDATLEEAGDDLWHHPTLCEGWDVRDLLCHLWLQAEVGLEAMAGQTARLPAQDGSDLALMNQRIDEAVKANRDVAGPDAWDRWRRARSELVRQLRERPDHARIPWTVSPMSPTTFATTLLMEAWTHHHDVRAPLGMPPEETPRMRHVAWFIHVTLPFAFRSTGQGYAPVRFELDAPGGGSWSFGPEDTDEVVRGSALELCLRGVDRLDLADARTLNAQGSVAETALRVMRAFP